MTLGIIFKPISQVQMYPNYTHRQGHFMPGDVSPREGTRFGRILFPLAGIKMKKIHDYQHIKNLEGNCCSYH